MLPIAILSILIVNAFAESCPKVESTPNFDPSKIAGKWNLLVHTEKSEADKGCCTCASSTYTVQNDGFIISERTGITSAGTNMNAITGLRPTTEGKGHYTHHVKVNDVWVATGATVSVYSEEEDCLGFLACVESDIKSAKAVFMCRSPSDGAKQESFKTWLNKNGFSFDKFYTIEHENCQK